jgi:ribosome-binding factor A
MRDVRHEKLVSLVHRRASEVILYELKDPRLGFVTVTRVKLSRDLRHATVYWSVVGPASDRSKTARALDHARGFVQSEIAAALRTRVTPALAFEYDESVEGSVRVSRILDELRRQRGDGGPSSSGGDEE